MTGIPGSVRAADGGYTLDDNPRMMLRWPSRFAAFALWSLAALSATAWVLKVVGMSEAPVTASAIEAQAPAIDGQDLARALGPDTPADTPALVAAAQLQQQAPDPAARLRLLGVVAGRRAGGVALISVDGQSPRPYRVGSEIDASYRLTRVAARSATLAPMKSDAKTITLELPPVGAAAGQLPGAAAALPGRPPDLLRANPQLPGARPAAGATAQGNATAAENNEDARKD
jgi:general secretion pathway protein C